MLFFSNGSCSQTIYIQDTKIPKCILKKLAHLKYVIAVQLKDAEFY